MTLTRYLAVGALAAAIATGANAQTLRQNSQPAEFPPANYTGSQYVDSKGCVFIRAGVDGAVTWVPRVNRDRRLVCGQQPTRIAEVTASAATRTASAPVQIVPTAPVPAAPSVSAPAPVATAPAPKAAPVPAAAPAPRPVVQNRGGNCPNASDFSNLWVNDGSAMPERCGPQAQPQRARHQTGGSVAAGGERILPAHVYANRFNSRNVTVPKGYAPVWKDDRLNPHRAEGTVQGHIQMQQIWTNTVPRRLVGPAAEPAVRQPRIVSPAAAGFTRAEATVMSTRGTVAREHVARKVVAPASPAAAPGAKATGAFFVQVATFGVPANAQATAQRLAGTGLPVRMGRLTRGGATYQTVLAGPFSRPDEARAALGTARALGFADAFIR